MNLCVWKFQISRKNQLQTVNHIDDVPFNNNNHKIIQMNERLNILYLHRTSYISHIAIFGLQCGLKFNQYHLCIICISVHDCKLENYSCLSPIITGISRWLHRLKGIKLSLKHGNCTSCQMVLISVIISRI